MTFEVMGLEVGVLRMRDLRLAVRDLRAGHPIAVLVLGASGESPFVGPVTLTTKRSGHSEHPAFLCTSCGSARRILYLHGGALACATCAGARTRRQRERTLASWRRGGKEEDRLMRLVRRGGRVSRMRALVDEIVAGDTDRAAVIVEAFRDVVLLMEQRDGSR